MISRRRERVQSFLREEVSQIVIRELVDPRMGFVTVTRVEVTPDLREAIVFVSVIGDETEVRKTFAGLEHSAPYVQRRIARDIELKNTPKIRFVVDESIKKSARISELLKKISEERGEDEGEDEGDESDEA